MQTFQTILDLVAVLLCMVFAVPGLCILFTFSNKYATQTFCGLVAVLQCTVFNKQASCMHVCCGKNLHLSESSFMLSFFILKCNQHILCCAVDTIFVYMEITEIHIQIVFARVS